MPRTKTFDRETVLATAATVFATHGYEGTSTEVLLQAMGIGRQSLYDTFGDKRQLYLAALAQYQSASVAATLRALRSGKTPLDSLEEALLQSAAAKGPEGCLGVNATCEFGQSDDEVTRSRDAMGHILQAAFEQCFAEARAAGQVDKKLEVADVARFLATVLSGMSVSARAGASQKELRAVARMALRSLQERRKR